MVPKILFIRRLAAETLVHSAVVEGKAMHWRALRGLPETTAAFAAEHFSLLILDHRAVAGDPLALLATLRLREQQMPVILISEPLPMEGVIRAIRIGVKDMFHAPIKMEAIVERVHAVLSSQLGSSRGPRLEDWRDLVSQLCANEAGATTVLEHPGGPGIPSDGPVALAHPAGLTNANSDLATELKKLATERQLLVDEMKKLEDERRAAKILATELTAREQSIATERKMIDEMAGKLDAQLADHSEAKIWLEQERETFAKTREPSGDTPPQIAIPGSESLARLVELEEKLDLEHQLVKQAQAKLGREREAHAQACLAQQMAADQVAKDWAELAARLQEIAAKEKSHTEAAANLAFEREKLAAAQGIFQQAQLQQDLVANEKVQSAQKEFVTLSQLLAEKERAQVEAAARLAGLEEKLESEHQIVKQAQVKLALERDAVAKAQAAQQDAAGRAAKFEADAAARAQSLAAKEKAQSDTATKLAAEQEKFSSAHRALQQAQAKLDQDRVAIEQAQAAHKDTAARTQALATKERMQAEAAGRLTALEEQLDSEQQIVKQAQTKLAQEREAFAQTQAAAEKANASAVARAAAEQQKFTAAQRAELAQLQAQRAALDTDRAAAKEAAAKFAAERKDLEAQRAQLDQRQRENAARESLLQEAEAQSLVHAAQRKKAEAQLANDRAALAAEKFGLDEEAMALTGRLRAFESKQLQLKEQMKQLLAAS